MMKNNINSIIFKKEYKILLNLIRSDQKLKSRIIKSKYFREYAFNNQYELLAVFFEYFIDTSKDLKANFPDIYFSILKM